MDPSSPDQAAFHEGFADVVALALGLRAAGRGRAHRRSRRGQKESPSRRRRIPDQPADRGRGSSRGCSRWASRWGARSRACAARRCDSSGKIPPSLGLVSPGSGVRGVAPPGRDPRRRGAARLRRRLASSPGGPGRESAASTRKTLDRSAVVEEGASAGRDAADDGDPCARLRADGRPQVRRLSLRGADRRPARCVPTTGSTICGAGCARPSPLRHPARPRAPDRGRLAARARGAPLLAECISIRSSVIPTRCSASSGTTAIESG